MLELTPDECRVLGVLVEKAQTTPGQYPMTLNSLTAGCNQKNNRNPVVEWDDERVFDAVDGLRAKKLVNEVMLTGSRVAKYKHNSREVLGVDTSQLVVLTELLLRGPQSLGDIRGNASRMHPLESLDTTRAVIDSLMAPARPEPLVREDPPPPGSRARLFRHLLSAESREHSPSAPNVPDPGPLQTAPIAGAGDLAGRIAALETELARVKGAVSALAAGLGSPDPLA